MFLDADAGRDIRPDIENVETAGTTKPNFTIFRRNARRSSGDFAIISLLLVFFIGLIRS
jgi:hypothetical protein